MSKQRHHIHITLSGASSARRLAEALAAAFPALEQRLAEIRQLVGAEVLTVEAAHKCWQAAPLDVDVRAIGDAILSRVRQYGGEDNSVDLAAVAIAASVQAELSEAVWSVGDLPLGDITSANPAIFGLLEGYRWVAGPGACPDLSACAIISELNSSHSTGCTPFGAPLSSASDAAGTTLVQIFDYADSDTVGWIAFDIDDMTGEEIAHACDHLRSLSGLIDLSLFAGQGKKGRPVMRFELLAQPEQLDTIIAAAFEQTTTLGLRYDRQARRILPRWPSEGIEPRAKYARRPDGATTAKIEADDVASLPTLKARREAARN
ncbi:nickel insertion protein [Notoacmeibacter sp. MSK16QG-6]|uniref:nickel insertion protein n=1 Tax=Notoacmeibacter sp. MSK16QG-6 TaxID=2957982 RepID=UPI00209CC60A|nr:nickel insertion protein [Notoacmeibacter sp. MSK16QG-6]MCP1199579.1 LarC family nickel insertion protein [Notoacmeibacter sp. MSK16QG-6]